MGAIGSRFLCTFPRVGHILTALEVRLFDSQWMSLKKNAARKWSLYRILVPSVIGLLLSFGCYALGYVYSDQNSSLPLARSGSAAAAILILFSLYNVGNILTHRQAQAEPYFEKITKGLSLTGQQSQERIRKKLVANTEHATRSVVVTNALGLSLATVVDLPRFSSVSLNWI